MSINLDEVSIAQWFPDQEKHRCGYCKNEVGSISYGMWAETLTVQDYQDLIDRGWRRSGKYCYKPIMTETCCPQYTIKCSALNFSLSKSQKKVIKKFNKFLNDGILNKNDIPHEAQMTESNEIYYKEAPTSMFDRNKLTSDKINIDEQGDVLFDDSNQCTLNNACDKPIVPSNVNISPSNSKLVNINSSGVSDKNAPKSKGSYKEGEGADPNKPPSKKAKLLRLEKKKNKLLQRGMSLEKLDVVGNKQKSIEEFLGEVPENAKHKLKLTLIQTCPPSLDWENSKETEFEIYKKYQMTVHNDPLEKCSMRGFVRFLVASPLKAVTFPNREGPGYGSFHQQYWLDDKLIAVGVIDILPKCVSSVYFFYDPDYRNLTLGTYGSLRELEFTRHLHDLVPEIDSYYMGFYIHSCPKMRYKGKLTPSYLLCPETYDWFPIENCLSKLDEVKYSRLNEDLDAIDENACSDKDINEIKILYDYNLTLFKYFKRKFGKQNVFNNIGELIGRKCSKNILFVMDK